MASKTTRKTRKQSTCPIFGVPNDLKSNVLPTYKDVMKCYLYFMQKLREKNNGKQPSLKEISEMLSKKIEDLWKKASIPSVSHERVLKMFHDYHRKYRNLVKNIKPKMTDVFKAKVGAFKDNAAKTLFDISACKCADIAGCICPKIRKVPIKEQEFLTDQRTTRKMYMSAIDVKTSLQLQAREQRQNKVTCSKGKEIGAAASSKQHYEQLENLISSSQSYDSEEDYATDTDEVEDPNFLEAGRGLKRKRKSTATTQQMRLSLPSLAMACDRTGVSNRGAAILASAVLEDLKIITKEDKSKVIDKTKIQREKKKLRLEIKLQEKGKASVLEGLYFDGRKDTTIVMDKAKGNCCKSTIKEEHVVLVSEPGSNYMGHVSPASGHGHSIKSSIISWLNSKDISTSELVALGCDGTNVNVGASNGVIGLIEKALDRPVQWLICLLHANELPLRHLIQHLDGPTSGPHGFTGPIGKQIQFCENFELVEFAPVEVELPEVDKEYRSTCLSSDQKYLIDICEAVASGNCSQALARMNPGKLSHARWLTTANRILRYYVGCSEPTENLRIIVEYIMRVYCKMWFKIKVESSCTDGARHLWNTIKLSRYLSSELKAVIDPVIQRNGFYGHPENIILSMISDKRPHVRKLGLLRIMKARGMKSSTAGIRQFKIPVLNFESSDYIDMIDWQTCKLMEPPVTMKFSDEALKNMVDTGEVLGVGKFPCHTQAVERYIKLVTEASAAVCGAESRDGYIQSRLASRKLMPSFNTKSEYNSQQDSRE